MADGILGAILRPFIGSSGDAAAVETAQSPQQIRENALARYRKNKGAWNVSLNELQQVAKTEFGATDWKTNYWVAKIAMDHEIFEESFPAAKKAVGLAKTTDEKEKSKAIFDYLEKSFAPVTFIQAETQKAQGVKDGYIGLVDKTGLINPQKKKAFEAIRRRLSTTKVELPKTFYLPLGKYVANDLTEFEIEKGKERTAMVALFDKPLMTEPTDWGLVGIVGGLLAIGAAGVAGLISPREQQRGEVR